MIPQLGKSADTNYSRNNIMSPLNWFAFIADSCLVAGIIGSDDTFVKVICLIIFFLVSLFYGGVYIFFMLKDPDRLQTEEHNIKLKELTLFDGNTNIKNP